MQVLGFLWGLLELLVKWVVLPLLFIWLIYWGVMTGIQYFGKDPRPALAHTFREWAARLYVPPTSASVLDPKWHLDNAHTQREAALRQNREARNSLVYAEALNAANEQIAQYDKGVAPNAHPYDTLYIAVFRKSDPYTSIEADVYYVTSIFPDKVKTFRTSPGPEVYRQLFAKPGTTYKFVAQLPSGEWTLPNVVTYQGRMKAPKDDKVKLWAPQ